MTTPRKNSCGRNLLVIFFGFTVIVAVLAFFVVFGIPEIDRLEHHQEVSKYLEQWQKNNISSYTMVVESFDGSQQIATFAVEVRNNQVVEDVNSQQATNTHYTVEGLFKTAFECTGFFCSVAYDPMYVYLRHIVWGFHERARIEVVDFQPEPKANR
ncbi:MAG: hypothetical protein HZC41_01355 [Chloroflexi bacterium]|nr:hypothetical protein [Chloroflexota bacterium]